MEIPIIIDLEEIIQRGINILQANGSKLTDFNGGTTSYGVAYEGLKIGDDIIKSTILAIILNHEAVQDVTLDVPAGNVTILANDAGRVGTITLTEGV